MMDKKDMYSKKKCFNKIVLSVKVMLFMVIAVPHFGVAQYSDSLNAISLDGTWQFKTDPYDRGLREGWYRKDNTDSGYWDSLTVPGNWDLRNEYAEYAGKAWYKREFDADSEWQVKNVRLFFESVYNDAAVWINGRQVGENHLGFLPFFFDINEYVDFGAKNTVVVLVDNTLKRGAMWNWGGIRRPVSLEITDKNRVEYQHITAIPDFEQQMVPIYLSFELANYSPEESSLEYSWEVLKAGTDDVLWKKSADAPLKLATNTTVLSKDSLYIPISEIQLWDFNSPNLYYSVLRLYKNGIEIHQLKDRFGIRKLEIVGDEIKLNGKTIRPVGFNLVADDRTTGSTLPTWRIKEDVDLMKSAGANMARLSHQPLPKEFLDYLDEKGIMTFEEVALWGKDVMVDPDHPAPKEWLNRMIRYKYNHPSVVGWSVGNEIGVLDDNPMAMEYVAGAIKQAKEEDPSRIAVYVTHSADTQQDDPAKFSDMVFMNEYADWGKRAEKVRQYQPRKPIFYSEFGAKITHEDPNLGKIEIKKMLDEMRDKAYLIGASVWTFNDYRSSYSGTPPSQNRSWGVVNVFRQKKRAYHDFRKEYAPVKELKLENLDKVIISPRGIYDIPAYELNNYHLIWEANDKNGKLIDGGFTILPQINPGDREITQGIKWKKSIKEFASVKISILDPHGYAVYDTVSYLKRPAVPELISTHVELNKIRVVFKRGELASAWKARYKVGDNVIETAETINDFITIGGLEPERSYDIELIAVNNAGESKPLPFTAKTTSNELPPVVWHTEATDGGFFIGYSVDPKDYVYQIQYGTTSGDYDNYHAIQVRNKGVLNISGLTNGKKYYYRIRRLMQWGFESGWSNEVQVVAGLTPLPPKITGVLKKDNQAVLVIQPANKASGYIVKCTDVKTGNVHEVSINASQLNYIFLSDLQYEGVYKFEIATKLDSKISSYVSLVN